MAGAQKDLSRGGAWQAGSWADSRGHRPIIRSGVDGVEKTSRPQIFDRPDIIHGMFDDLTFALKVGRLLYGVVGEHGQVWADRAARQAALILGPDWEVEIHKRISKTPRRHLDALVRRLGQVRGRNGDCMGLRMELEEIAKEARE